MMNYIVLFSLLLLFSIPSIEGQQSATLFSDGQKLIIPTNLTVNGVDILSQIESLQAIKPYIQCSWNPNSASQDGLLGQQQNLTVITFPGNSPQQQGNIFVSGAQQQYIAIAEPGLYLVGYLVLFSPTSGGQNPHTAVGIEVNDCCPVSASFSYCLTNVYWDPAYTPVATLSATCPILISSSTISASGLGFATLALRVYAGGDLNENPGFGANRFWAQKV